MYYYMVFALYLCFVCVDLQAQIYPQPEQIHLSIGYDPSSYTVTWVTLSQTNESTVQIRLTGQGSFTSISGTEDVFVDGGSEKRSLYMHRVQFPVKPNLKYEYRVGSDLGWSSLYWFKSLSTDTNWSPRFAVYGDMGNKNAKSLPALQLKAESGELDMILHIGDFAYNMDSDNARYGDEFMRQIEPIASILPYMTCPGNHEAAYNFSNYRRRFSMKGGDGEGQFFSFNVGPAHLIMISTEFYYYASSYGWQQIVNQYNWLQKDLKEANQPSNRAKRPWIIVMGHRPMYCSNSNDAMHCTNVDNLIRVGIPYSTPYGKTYMFGLEDLFYKFGVDLMFWAHEHSYERHWPLYNRKVCNGTSEPYTDPPGPVHVVTGSAGCQEGVDPFIPNGEPWSAFRSDDYGYTLMNIANSTHLYMEQISDDKKTVIDRMTYIRTKHGAGIYTCK